MDVFIPKIGIHWYDLELIAGNQNIWLGLGLE